MILISRYYGMYQFAQPALVLRTPDIIKKMCVKDFDYLLNRMTIFNEKSDVLLSKTLVGLKGIDFSFPLWNRSLIKRIHIVVAFPRSIYYNYDRDCEITICF